MRLAGLAGRAAYLLNEALRLCERRGIVPAPQVHERAAAVWNLNHRRSAGDGCAGPRLGDGGVDSAPPVKRTPVVPNRHHRGGANLAPPRSPSPGTAGGVNLPPPYEDSAVQTLGGRTVPSIWRHRGRRGWMICDSFLDVLNQGAGKCPGPSCLSPPTKLRTRRRRPGRP